MDKVNRASNSALETGRHRDTNLAKTRRWGLRCNLLLLFLSTTISLILAESLLRFFPAFRPSPRASVGEYPNRPNKNFVADAETGWRLPPHHQFSWIIDGIRSTYRSNRQGFRGNLDFDPSDSRRKIVLVGDSFTFGTGVEYEETYGALLESQLSRSVVYNLAMPGFGIDQMWMSVRHQALPLKPSLVIIAFIDADFDRSLTAYRHREGLNEPAFKLLEGRPVPKTVEDTPNIVARILERNSWLLAAGHLFSRRVAYRIPLGEWWILNQALLDAITVDCRNSKTAALFVRIPTTNVSQFKTLDSHMRRLGTNFIDLADPKTSRPKAIHFREGHINADGHRYVADAILRWVRSRLAEF